MWTTIINSMQILNDLLFTSCFFCCIYMLMEIVFIHLSTMFSYIENLYIIKGFTKGIWWIHNTTEGLHNEHKKSKALNFEKKIINSLRHKNSLSAQVYSSFDRYNHLIEENKTKHFVRTRQIEISTFTLLVRSVSSSVLASNCWSFMANTAFSRLNSSCVIYNIIIHRLKYSASLL